MKTFYSKHHQVITIVMILLIGIAVFSVSRFWYLLQVKKAEPVKENVQLPSDKHEFTLRYADISPVPAENISIFHRSEPWKMNGFFDTKVYVDYPTSLVLAGENGDAVTTARAIDLNLEKISYFDLILFVHTDPDELEEAKLFFTDSAGNSAVFWLAQLQPGWNIIELPKEQFVLQDAFDWAKTSQVNFEFMPRPKGHVVVSLAGLRAEGFALLENDWNSIDKQALLYDSREGNTSVLLRCMQRKYAVATIKKIASAKDFSFQVSYSPMTKSWSGLFLRGNHFSKEGYYLMVNGLEGNKWKIVKFTLKDGPILLKEGLMNNMQFESEKWYYLKGVVKGSTITIYLSTQEESAPLGTAMDSEFSSGAVGIAINPIELGELGASRFDNFIYTGL